MIVKRFVALATCLMLLVVLAPTVFAHTSDELAIPCSDDHSLDALALDAHATELYVPSEDTMENLLCATGNHKAAPAMILATPISCNTTVCTYNEIKIVFCERCMHTISSTHVRKYTVACIREPSVSAHSGGKHTTYVTCLISGVTKSTGSYSCPGNPCIYPY